MEGKSFSRNIYVTNEYKYNFYENMPLRFFLCVITSLCIIRKTFKGQIKRITWNYDPCY